MNDKTARAITREYRTVRGQKCSECGNWVQGGIYALFEPWLDATRVCGWLCQECAEKSGVPVWPKIRAKAGEARGTYGSPQ